MTNPIRKPAQEAACCSWPNIQEPTFGSMAVNHGIIESINLRSHPGSFGLISGFTAVVLVPPPSGSAFNPLASGEVLAACGRGKIFAHLGDVEVQWMRLVWIWRE